MWKLKGQPIKAEDILFWMHYQHNQWIEDIRKISRCAKRQAKYTDLNIPLFPHKLGQTRKFSRGKMFLKRPPPWYHICWWVIFMMKKRKQRCSLLREWQRSCRYRRVRWCHYSRFFVLLASSASPSTLRERLLPVLDLGAKKDVIMLFHGYAWICE